MPIEPHPTDPELVVMRSHKFNLQKPWVGLTVEERNACLVSADPCEALADPEAKQLMEDIEEKLRSKNT